MANLIVYPNLYILITFIAAVGIARQQVFHVMSQLACRFSERLSARTRLFGQPEEERARLGLAARIQRGAALGAHEHVALGVVGCQAIRQTHHFRCIEGYSQGAASFRLGAVGLIHHPIARARQKPAIGRKVAEEQRMIGDHDVSRLGLFAQAVDKALRAEIRAFATQAVARRGGERITRQRLEIQLEAVDIVVIGLLDERKQRRDRGRLAHVLAGHIDRARAVVGNAINQSQAGIVREPLERHIGKVALTFCRKTLGKQGQLFIDDLIEQGIRFGGNTDRNMIAHGGKRARQQIRHGFAHAGACFHHKIRSRGERLQHLVGHDRLLFARFETLVEAAHDTFSRKCLRDLARIGKLHDGLRG